MSALTLTLTNAGLARIAAAQLGNPVDMRIAAVGLTDTAFAVAPTLTALPGEFRRVATVSGTQAGGNTVHLTVRDDAAITYGVRGLGVFLSDGVLFAVYGQADRIMQKAAAATNLLALDIAFPAGSAAAVTFGDTSFLNPPASTQTKGVVRLASPAAIDAGTSADDAVTPAGLRRALPIGVVTLWYGSDATVPAGWAICNGQEVTRSDGAGKIITPDLRDRVAVGAGANAQGSTFGANSRTVSSADGGAHTPAGRVPDITVTTSKVVTGITAATTTKTDTASGGSGTTLTSVTLADPGHTHTASITGAPALSMDAVPAHKHDVTVDVRQPGLALHYIMKV